MATAKNIIKGWFKNKKKPKQEHFWAWLDSYFHKEEKIPIESVKGLLDLLQSVATSSQINAILEKIEELENKQKTGLQNDKPIPLEANAPYQYLLPDNCNLYAVKINGDCVLKIGTEENAGDFGEMDTPGFVELGFVNGNIWFTADKAVDIIPIIYKF